MKSFSKSELEELYRSEDSEQIRGAIKKIEAEAKAILGEDPLDFYLKRFPNQKDSERVKDIVGARCVLLNRLFRGTKEEVERLSAVNEHLLSLNNQMYHRTCELYRTVLAKKDSDFDDDYEVEGALMVSCEYEPGNDFDSVLHLPDDDYYGSDFSYMIYVTEQCEEQFHGEFGKQIEFCQIGHRDEYTSNSTDKELDCVNTDEYGVTWAEGALWHPSLKDIIIHHPIHSLCTHHDYSIPDVLRINSYWIDIKLVCQRITDYY